MKIPKFFHVWKVLSGLEKYPEYRIYTEKIQQMEPKEYIRLKIPEIRAELHKLHSNKVQMEHKGETQNVVGLSVLGKPHGEWETVGRDKRQKTPERQNKTQPYKHRSVTPRKYPIETTLKHYQVPEGECMGYFTHGKCPRLSKNKPCHFSHTQQSHKREPSQPREHSQVRFHTPQNNYRSNSLKNKHNQNNYRTSISSSPVTPQHYSSQQRVSSRGVSSGGVCGTCGNTHGGKCLWNKRCYNCGGIHSVKVCLKTTTIQKYGGNRRNSV